MTIIDNKAYIFGGETAAGKLAGDEVHAVTLQASGKPEPDYAVVPAIPDVKGDAVPAARKEHAACALNVCIAVFGGVDEKGAVIDESFVWLFVTAKSSWEKLEPLNKDVAPKARKGACLFEHQNNLVLYGGFDDSGNSLKDVWHLGYATRTWTQLADAPISTKNAALSDGALHLISGGDSVSGNVHHMPITIPLGDKSQWTTIPFPANPLTPGPQPRNGAGLLPLTTGYGRQYLLYMFGARASTTQEVIQPAESLQVAGNAENPPPEFWSDLWTYQLASSDSEVKATTNIYEAIKPAKIKDKIRDALGYDSGKHQWEEVEVLPPTDLEASEGKVHPGPRSFFACDVMKDGRSVVIWGGMNPKGEREGDGWLIKLE